MAIDPGAICGFCGKAYGEHLDSRPPEAPVPRCGCTLLKKFFTPRKIGTSDPIADLLQAQSAKLAAQPTEQRAPTSTGWWARKRGGRIAWFWVEVIESDDGRGDGGASSLMIWTSHIEDFLPVSLFCSPLTRWSGPVALPPKWEKDATDG